jgi:hypothetical protein
MPTKPTKFRAVCFVCYTCHLSQPVGKREAERIACSHMNAYGHNTSVQSVESK